MSSRVDWARGISAAPAMPCRKRKATIWPRLWAAPHRAEVMVNPATETRNTVLRPSLSDSQPVSGVMIAAATM